MEYKRDRRDEKFYMVEPTVGRTDYQEEIATLNGVNIPAAAYLREIGDTVQQPFRQTISDRRVTSYGSQGAQPSRTGWSGGSGSSTAVLVAEL